MLSKDFMSTTTLIVAISLGGLAQAQENKGDRPDRPDRAEIFKSLDADGSGEITQEELATRGADRFTRIDANGDGLLSAEEIIADRQKQTEQRTNRMIERLDANNDGQLSQAEVQGRRDPTKVFARLDTDNSGGISQEEFEKARHRRGNGKKRGE
ncbi:MAG: EF-hand domain-containing protein [Paracoccaceae bacterium]